MRLAIETLHPEWVEGSRDWADGVAFDCWACKGRHTVWFEQGAGGYGSSSPDSTSFWREGTSFSTLTLHPAIEVAGCFRAWLRDGIFHVAEH